MTIEEIFNKISSHMIQGLTYHAEMAEMYDFIALYGYAQEQNYHYIEESESYRQLSHYYTSHYYKLTVKENINDPKIIPDSWYKYSTMSIDTSTKRQLIKELMNKWVNWEKSTKKLYQEMWQELHTIGEIAAAQYLEKYIEDVTKELSHAEQKLIQLETIGYDIIIIVTEQEDLYKKYTKKLRW